MKMLAAGDAIDIDGPDGNVSSYDVSSGRSARGLSPNVMLQTADDIDIDGPAFNAAWQLSAAK
jgi:hypothetical protein